MARRGSFVDPFPSKKFKLVSIDELSTFSIIHSSRFILEEEEKEEGELLSPVIDIHDFMKLLLT